MSDHRIAPRHPEEVPPICICGREIVLVASAAAGKRRHYRHQVKDPARTFRRGAEVLPTRTMPSDHRAMVGDRVGLIEEFGQFWAAVEYDFGLIIGLRTDWRIK